MDPTLKTKVDSYFKHIRPKLAEPGQDIANLFILPGSRPIGNIMRFLEGQLNISIPSCTRARKIAATSAVQQLDDASNAIISAQMSHSADTARRYYRAVTGPKQAASVYKMMEGLRKQTPSVPGPRTPPRNDGRWCTKHQSVPGPSTPPSGSKMWSMQDTEYVEGKFRKFIESKRAPSLQECAVKAHILSLDTRDV